MGSDVSSGVGVSLSSTPSGGHPFWRQLRLQLCQLLPQWFVAALYTFSALCFLFKSLLQSGLKCLLRAGGTHRAIYTRLQLTPGCQVRAQLFCILLGLVFRQAECVSTG